MNVRRIQTARVLSSPFGPFGTERIQIGESRFIVDGSIVDYVGRRSFKFARRPFAGARRIRFIYDGFYEGYLHYPRNSNALFICREKSRKLLGIGKRTKQFSLWFKLT